MAAELSYRPEGPLMGVRQYPAAECVVSRQLEKRKQAGAWRQNAGATTDFLISWMMSLDAVRYKAGTGKDKIAVRRDLDRGMLIHPHI
jgi:hypothetical protein